MHIEKDRFGEDIVLYDSQAEQLEAIRNYLCGNLAALTCEEVLQLRACVEDPNNVRWEAEHAGMMSVEVDELDVNGIVFIHDLGHTFEEGKQLLLKKIGPHPITYLTLWQVERELIEPQVASRHADMRPIGFVARSEAKGGDDKSGRPQPCVRRRRLRLKTTKHQALSTKH